jgi:hypothetical protein
MVTIHRLALLAAAAVAPLLPSCALFGIPGDGEDQGAVRTPQLVTRVGGDREASIEIVNGQYRVGRSLVEAPLPEGYPEPTPPGAIDLKRYPSVRRAELSRTGSPDGGMNSGFWPLFNHIKDRDIAMTSPVEMDYEGMPLDGKGRPERWTMSFLYRTTDLGPTGDAGKVVVVDTEAMTVLSIGLNGSYGLDRVKEGMAKLEAWLTEHPEWIAEGSPRAFYYNGPYVQGRRKWSEIQVPVRRADGEADWPAEAENASTAEVGETSIAAKTDPVD